MPTPTEHKTAQSRILEYTQESGWTFVPRVKDEEPAVFPRAICKVAEVQERPEKS